MKAQELKELEAEELGSRLKQARRELYELRFKLAVGQLENNREIRKVRKDIARILTVIHQHRLEDAEYAATATAVAERPATAEELAAVDEAVEAASVHEPAEDEHDHDHDHEHEHEESAEESE